MGPRLPDIKTIIQAGIDPKTGLPLKAGLMDECQLQNDIRRAMRIKDEQTAVNRFKWHNLPENLNGRLIERILYYKGQAAFFYSETMEQFYFLPYALDGTIDVYGQFMGITPLPFGNGTGENEDKKKRANPFQGVIKKPYYDVVLEDDINAFRDGCVILRDYSNQISQTNIPRQIIQEPILNTISEMIPLMRTTLFNSTNVRGLRITDQDQESVVDIANESKKDAALNGKGWVPIAGNMEFQELGDGTGSTSDQFLMAMQSLDNFRLSLYGLENGGLFQKKAHVLQDEENVNMGQIDLIMQDGLTLRQEFCDIVNSIWGLAIWVEVSETVSEADKNMDGEISDETESQNMLEMEGHSNGL